MKLPTFALGLMPIAVVAGRVQDLTGTERTTGLRGQRNLKKPTPPPNAVCPTSTSAGCEYDALILGLGWAGVAAMYELQLFNNHTASLFKGSNSKDPICYKGIEHADYFGGRIIAGELVSGADKNPIGELIHLLFSQNQGQDDYLLHSQQTWSDIYYYSLERNATISRKEVGDAHHRWNYAYDCLQRVGNEELQTDGPGTSMYDVLNATCDYDIRETDIDSPKYVTPLEQLLDWYELAWEFVISDDLSTLSAKGNVPLWTYYMMQDKDWFVTSEQILDEVTGEIVVPGNLATVADKTVKTYIPNYEDTAVLGTKVKKVENNSGCVKVDTDPIVGSSDTILTDKALITFSVGALVNQAATANLFSLFNPTIDDKMQAFKDTFYLDYLPPYENTMGLYKMLFVQLSKDEWDAATIPNKEFIFTVPELKSQVGHCTFWQSFDRYHLEFFEGSRSFACTLVTEDYKLLASGTSGLLDDSVVQSLIANLFKALKLDDPSVTSPCLRAPCHNAYDRTLCDDPSNRINRLAKNCSRIDLFPDPDLNSPEVDYPPWATGTGTTTCPLNPDEPRCVYEIRDTINPNWQGSWSTFKTGWKQDDYDLAMAPVPNNTFDPNHQLYFAGEALCPRYQGFQHGAWDSGRLQAREMIYELRDFDEEDKEDWGTFSDGYVRPPLCFIPDGEPPIRKSKTVP